MNKLAGKRVDLLRKIDKIILDCEGGQLKDDSGDSFEKGKDYTISDRASDNRLKIYDDTGELVSDIEFEK